jgi:hypothetical protein
VKTNRRFGGTYRVHIQGSTASKARKQLEAGSKFAACFLVSLHPTTSRHIPQGNILKGKRWLTFSEL